MSSPQDESNEDSMAGLAVEEQESDEMRPQSAPQPSRPRAQQLVTMRAQQQQPAEDPSRLEMQDSDNQQQQQQQQQQHFGQQPQHQDEAASRYLATTTGHRASFVSPHPVSGMMPTSGPGKKTLTNHEIYEMMQKQQQQQFRASLSVQGQPMAPGRPSGGPSSSGGGSSNQRPKHQSLYLGTGKTRNKHKDLARQNSLIVGTPSFQERYDSNSNLGLYKGQQQQQQQQPPQSPGQFNPYQQFQQQQAPTQLVGVNNSIPLQQQQHQPTMDHQQAQFNQQQQQHQGQIIDYPMMKQQNLKQQQQQQQSPSQDDQAPFQTPIHHPHPVHPHFTGYDINSTSDESTNICAIFLTALSLLLVLVTFPFSLFLCIKVVQEYERVVIFRLGRLLKGGARGPGIFFIIPCIDTYCKVDLRTVSFDVPPQEILSRDSVTVAVDAVVYYRISNATIAVANVENYGRSTRLLAATTLRNVLGTKNLSEILSEREIISHIMQASLDEATEPWGVKVERVEIKDVRLPVQLQRAMAAEAEAAREARAKVIAAEGEQKASKALRSAAEVISMSPQAIQLRYLQTLNSIAAEKNSTIVFPLPLELFSCFGARAMQMQGGSNPNQQQLQYQEQQRPLQQQQQQQQQHQHQQVAVGPSGQSPEGPRLVIEGDM